MQKPSSWRELLASIISNPAERERIAAEAGVRPITLTRWINGEAKPRPQNLHSLIKALPKQHQDQFRELIEGEGSLSYAVLSGEREQLEEIPYKFINRSEEHTSELQSHLNLVCRLLLGTHKNRHTPPNAISH